MTASARAPALPPAAATVVGVAVGRAPFTPRRASSYKPVRCLLLLGTAAAGLARTARRAA